MNSHWEHLQTFQSSVDGIQLTGHSGPQEEQRLERKRLFLRGVVSRERSSILTIYLTEQTCSKMLRPLWKCH